MRVGILQPCYIPWLGYFEQIHYTDCFIFLDDVQYTKEDWRNRNKVKTPRGPSWITIPVKHESSKQKICETQIIYSEPWYNRHINVLQENYRKAPYFDEVMNIVVPRLRARPLLLQDLTIGLILDIAGYMGIGVNSTRASDLEVSETDRNGRLIELCKRVKATELYDGPSAREFLDVPRFEAEGIRVKFQDYRHPAYNQFFGPFISHLSIVDLLFHHGPGSGEIVASGHGTH